MKEPVSDGISLSTAILLTLIVVSVGILLWGKVQPLLNKSDKNLSTINTTLTASEFSSFDKQNNSGASVIGAINTKASSTLHVEVTTAAGDTTTYTGSTYNIQDINSPKYIEPTGNFYTTIVPTTNGSISAIKFVQNGH